MKLLLSSFGPSPAHDAALVDLVGKPLDEIRVGGGAHGFDVDEQGNGTLADQRLYQLIRQPGSIGERRFEIEFLDAGAEAYCFTFG